MKRRIAMRREEEPMKSLNMMQRPNDWPRYPILPVKRYVPGRPGLPDCGCMVAGANDAARPVVYEVTMFQLSGKKLSELPKKEYADLGAVVRDGWIVD